MRDLRFVSRSLLRRPAYLFSGIGTLALVLGATTTLFAVVSATIFRPLPVIDGDRVVRLHTMPPGVTGRQNSNPLHAIDFVEFRERTRSLESVEGFTLTERVLTDVPDPEIVHGGSVSAGLFRLFADQPILGRTITDEEDRSVAHVAVISYGFWQRRFGGASDAVGKTLYLDGQPHRIVGVMPQRFPPPYLAGDVWTPLGLSRSTVQRDEPRTYIISLGKLVQGATVDSADAEFRKFMTDLTTEVPLTHQGWTGGAESYRLWQFGDLTIPLLVLLAAVAIVVVIACSNVAGLTLTQVMARRGEFAVRLAMGASAVDLTRLLFYEICVLCAAGSTLGLLLAHAALPLVLRLYPDATQPLGDVSIDWRVNIFVVAAAFMTAVGIAVAPTWHLLRGNISAGVRESSARSIGSRRANRLSQILLAAQTALCLALLICGGLLIRGLAKASDLRPGFTADHVLTAQLRLPATRYQTDAQRDLVVRQLLDRVKAIPDVASASTTMNAFLPGFAYQTLIDIENQPTPDGSPITIQWRRTSPGYFATMQIREIRGRTFTGQDNATSMPVAVVSKSFADHYWRDQDPIGRRIKRGAVWLTVVGVVDDVRDIELLRPPEPTLYVAWSQFNTSNIPVALVVKTIHDPLHLTNELRTAIASIDPRLALDRIQPLETFLDGSLAPSRFRTVLLSMLAGLGLLIGAIGIASLTARNVTERLREYGLRLALGCAAPNLWRAIVFQSLRSVAVGSVIGLVAGQGLSRLIVGLLPDVGTPDVMTSFSALATLAAVAAGAAALPATRVLRVNLVSVLNGR